VSSRRASDGRTPLIKVVSGDWEERRLDSATPPPTDASLFDERRRRPDGRTHRLANNDLMDLIKVASAAVTVHQLQQNQLSVRRHCFKNFT